MWQATTDSIWKVTCGIIFTFLHRVKLLDSSILSSLNSLWSIAFGESFAKLVGPYFSRLNAAWRDKFREKYYNENNTFEFQQNLADLKHSVDRAELAGTVPPQGYVNSFHGFLRYVSQEDGEKHLNAHWRSISLLCQPCRFVYNYILDIETAQDDSKFVFEELRFETRLPKDHRSSKTNKKSLEYYFKGQGCSNHFHISIFIFPELVPYCWMTVHFYQSLRPTTAQ